MRPSFVWLAAASCASLLAGCGSPDGGDGEGAAPFSGGDAYAYAEGLVEAGGPTGRVPGTEGHAAAAQWLEANAQAPGWSTEWHEVDWDELAAVPAGGVQGYMSSCSASDRERTANATVRNLIVTRGRDAGKPTVMLAAHWDSKAESDDAATPMPGANDGASGVGVLLELLRALPDSLPHNVDVVFFDAEDGFADCHPLAGSRAFAHLRPDLHPDLLILLDMVGDEDARFPQVGSAQAAIDLIWAAADRHGLGAKFVDARKSVLDDHTPFQERGVPTVDVIDFARPGTQFPPYWHTTHDTMEQLEPAMFARMGELLLDVLDEPGLATKA